MIRRMTIRDMDWLLLLITIAIAVVGVVEIYSTNAHTALAGQYRKQADWIVVGVILSVVISQIDYHVVMEHIAPFFLLGALGLVFLLVGGHAVAGTRRWVQLGGLTFQVSEMMKLVIIVCVAAYFGGRRSQGVSWRDIFALGILAGIPAILVALEPDLGTALTFFPSVAAVLFLAGIRWKQVGTLFLLALMMLPVGWRVMRPYQRARLMSFTHPKRNTQGSGYQVTQSKLAIGSGGFWGKGIGKGTQSRLGFIPVSHADFIFAAFAEEQGFVGTIVLMLLYFILLIRLLDGALVAGDRAGAYYVAGLASVLFFQVAVNVGMMIGFLPITGIPLPLMSQGGSSVLFTFIGLGLTLSIKMRRFVN